MDVTNDHEQRQELIEKSNGLRTVPQIFIDDQHIGGFDALRKLDMQGKLDALIQSHVHFNSRSCHKCPGGSGSELGQVSKNSLLVIN